MSSEAQSNGVRQRQPAAAIRKVVNGWVVTVHTGAFEGEEYAFDSLDEAIEAVRKAVA
jgi:hypothetical protein